MAFYISQIPKTIQQNQLNKFSEDTCSMQLGFSITNGVSRIYILTKTDCEADHPYHEISSVENVSSATEKISGTIDHLLEKVKHSNYTSA